MTDVTGGPEREWYAELDCEFGCMPMDHGIGIDGEEWIDPDVIRGVERVTGETYEDGTWHSNPSVS